jgi:hypothetical protein
MILPRRFRLLVLVLCVVALPASSALAGRKTAARPSVSSLSPPALAVGDTLTVRGHNFLPGKKRNSVVFKHAGSPEVTVKAAQATRTRMRVVVPAALAKYLTVAGDPDTLASDILPVEEDPCDGDGGDDDLGGDGP